MKEFQIPAKQIELEKRRRVIITMPICLVSVVVGVYVGISKSDYSGDLYIILPAAILFITIALILGIRRGNKMNSVSLSSYKIELSDNSIKKYQQNISTIEIQKSEVTSIIEIINRGLIIKTNKMNKYINIPVHVEGYSELKESLSEWMEITESERRKNQFLRIISVIGMLAGFCIVMLGNSSYIVVPVGIAMIIVLVVSSIITLNNPHIDIKIKKNSLFIILLIIAIIFRLLSFIL